MSKVLLKACWLAVWLGSGPMDARAAAQATVNDVLLGLGARAGVIFSGRVETVTRNDAAGFVDVRFRIDEAVRGCPKTGAYVLREWAGQWAARPERYTVGQRLLMLLTARGSSGMSAPVDGFDGVIPIQSAGVEPVADLHGVAPAEDGSLAPEAVADLRRLETRVVRTTAVAPHAAAGIVEPGEVSQSTWVGPSAPLLHVGEGSFAVKPSLSSVLAILRRTVTPSGGAHVAQ